MAVPPSKTFIQDMPPPGGFVKPPGFPAEAFRKRSPARGPGGIIMIAGAVGLTLFGMYRFLGDVEERKWVASVCLVVLFYFIFLQCEGKARIRGHLFIPPSCGTLC